MSPEALLSIVLVVGLSWAGWDVYRHGPKPAAPRVVQHVPGVRIHRQLKLKTRPGHPGASFRAICSCRHVGDWAATPEESWERHLGVGA